MKGKISQIKNNKGETAFPLTSSKAVYMQDGTTTVEKKFEEVNSSLEAIATYKTVKNNYIQDSINANTTILLTENNYIIDKTLNNLEGKTIKGIEGYTKLTFKGDIDCFDLTDIQNFKIEDIEILVEPSNTKNVFKLVGDKRYSYSNTIKNISINTTTKAIGRYTAFMLTANNSGVFKNQVINVSINNCNTAVLLGGGAKWVNMNTFDKLSIITYINGIIFNATGDILNNTFIRPMLEDTTSTNADGVEVNRMALQLEGKWNDIISPLIFNDGYKNLHYALKLTEKSTMNSISGGHIEGRVVGKEYLIFNQINTGLVDRDNFQDSPNQMLINNFGKTSKINILKNPTLSMSNGVVTSWDIVNLSFESILDADCKSGKALKLSSPITTTNNKIMQSISSYSHLKGKGILLSLRIKAKNIIKDSLNLTILDGSGNVKYFTIPERYYNAERYSVINYVWNPSFANELFRVQLQLNSNNSSSEIYLDYFRLTPIEYNGATNLVSGISLNDDNFIDVL